MAIDNETGRSFAPRNAATIAELRRIAGATAPLDPVIVVKRKAAEISTAMALLHGGDWRVEIDHQTGFVLVAPRIPPQKF